LFDRLPLGDRLFRPRLRLGTVRLGLEDAGHILVVHCLALGEHRLAAQTGRPLLVVQSRRPARRRDDA